MPKVKPLRCPPVNRPVVGGTHRSNLAITKRVAVGIAAIDGGKDVKTWSQLSFLGSVLGWTCLPEEWRSLTLSKHTLFWLPGELTRPQNHPTPHFRNHGFFRAASACFGASEGPV